MARRVKVAVLTPDEVQHIRDYVREHFGVVIWRQHQLVEELTVRLQPLADGRTQATVW
jgi:hypothetical protein